MKVWNAFGKFPRALPLGQHSLEKGNIQVSNRERLEKVTSRLSAIVSRSPVVATGYSGRPLFFVDCDADLRPDVLAHGPVDRDAALDRPH